MRPSNNSGLAVCSQCSFSSRDVSKLQFFLKTTVCGHELFALNKEHLEYLKQIVSAKIRAHGNFLKKIEKFVKISLLFL